MSTNRRILVALVFGFVVLVGASFVLAYRQQLPAVTSGIKPAAPITYSAPKKYEAELQKRVQPEKKPVASAAAPSVAPPEPVLNWKSFEIPDVAAMRATQERAEARLRHRAHATLSFLEDPERAERAAVGGRYVVKVPTEGAGLVEQSYDEATNQLLTERWRDLALGPVTRVYFPDSDGVSLTAKDQEGNSFVYMSLPRESSEYVSTDFPNANLSHFNLGGRETTLYANYEERRLVESAEGRDRQFLILGAGRYQEVDERGERHLFYRMENGRMVDDSQ